MFEDFPYHQSILHSAEAVYEELPGFEEDIGECRTLADLPRAARDYLEFIADFVGVPVKLVGVGPGPRPGDLGGRRRSPLRAGRLSGRSRPRRSDCGTGRARARGSSCRSSMLALAPAQDPQREHRRPPAATRSPSVICTPTRPSRDQ